MGAGGIIAALGVGLGAAFLLSRREQQVSPTPVAPTNSCDALPAGYPRDVCNATKSVGSIIAGIGNALSGQSTAEKAAEWYVKDEKNKALNGAVEIPLLHGVRWCNTPYRPQIADGRPGPNPAQGSGVGGGGQGTRHPNVLVSNRIKGTVVRFANGCVPMQGAPGWEKCAPGTQSMGAAANAGLTATGNIPRHQSGDSYDWPKGDLASGYFDPFMTVSPTGTGETRIAPCSGSFPIPIPTGHFGYFYRGKPFTCPVGKHPDFSKIAAGGPVVAPACLGGYVPVGTPTTTPTPSVGETYLAGMGGLFEALKVNV